MMTTESAIQFLRSHPQWQSLIGDCYLDANVKEAAERFTVSAEFQAVMYLLKGRLAGGVVLDLGAGNGIASAAFARSGTRRVYALEPDASEEIGRGAIQTIAQELPITILDAFGENIPLSDESVDIVYARQVLHHTRDLKKVLHECMRVLRPAGLFLACREHVVDNSAQLRAFLASHAIHHLTGGENAFRLSEYLGAIEAAGLHLVKTLGPWDSVINTFPCVRNDWEISSYFQRLLAGRFGMPGKWIGRLPGVIPLLRWRQNHRGAGRLYSFLARK